MNLRALCILPLLLAPACATTPAGERGLDLAYASAVVEDSKLAVYDIAHSFEGVDDELVAKLLDLGFALDRVKSQLESARGEHGDVADLVGSIDAVLIATVPLVDLTTKDPKKQAVARAVVLAARAVLRGIRRSVAPNTDPPPEASPPMKPPTSDDVGGDVLRLDLVAVHHGEAVPGRALLVGAEAPLGRGRQAVVGPLPA